MLLSEMVRKVVDEQRLIDDPGEVWTNSTTMVTLQSYGNITLTVASLVVVKYKVKVSGGAGYWAVKIGDYLCTGIKYSLTDYIDAYGFTWLAAGTYAISIIACNTGGNSYAKDFQLGTVPFLDIVGSALGSYSAGISLTVTQRKLCIGTVKQAAYAISVVAATPDAVTNMENPGESLTNWVRVFVDGVQRWWTERWQDDNAKQMAHGRVAVPYGAGSSHTVTITKGNTSTIVHISVAACPWILPVETVPIKPVSLDFPLGATLYIIAEPLFKDPTKNVKVGKPRATGFQADNYYNASGTGILTASYTFDLVPAQMCVFADGFGGCISVIGVDVR